MSYDRNKRRERRRRNLQAKVLKEARQFRPKVEPNKKKTIYDKILLEEGFKEYDGS